MLGLHILMRRFAPEPPREIVRRAGLRRGFTLTEIAIVLGIAGLVLGAIWEAAADVYMNKKVALITQQTIEFVSNYRKLYGPRGAGVASWDNVTSLGVKAGYFPVDMMVGSTPTDPWGGAVNVWVQQTPLNTILVGFTPVTVDECIHLAASLTFLPGVIYENFAGTTNPTTFSTSISTYTPFSFATIEDLCTRTVGRDLQVGFKI
ncbi:MAG: prepilin-type N-terminal cleavage/methylation domain-containing protein [Alphaproteobacteria bacterium]|nr:prepilin-type N-terminal cleavage/methylation domain-containing protein [Alphaproteobacteria bacterium]